MATLHKKIILAGIAAIVVTALISIVIFSDILEGNTIKVSSEDFQLYKNQPYPVQIIQNCRDEMHCAVNAMQSISENESKEKVISTFQELVSLYDKNLPCHETAHHLGMWLYGYLNDVDKSLELAQQQCGGSVYHGVIQNYILTQKFQGTNLDDIELHTICENESENPYSIDHWQCLHGLGHGLAQLYDYDTLDAVKRCDEFQEGIEQISCSKGIFMQNVVHYFEAKKGDFNDSDKYYPCNAVDSKYSPTCYHYHVTYLGLINDRKLKQTFDDCDGIVPEEMIKYCYYGFGRQLSSNIKSIDDALFLCKAGKISEYHKYCLTGMVMTLVNGNKNPDIGFSFCSHLSQEYKESCYDGLGKWVKMLYSDNVKRDSECTKAENSEFVLVCRQASFDGIKLL